MNKPKRPFGPLKATRIATSRPCANCPFRADVPPFITAARVREIRDAAKNFGQHFVCHKTVDYDAPPGDDMDRRACAGFLLVCAGSRLLGGLQIVQLAERLAGVMFDALQGADVVYPHFTAMLAAHRRAEGRRRHARTGD